MKRIKYNRTKHRYLCEIVRETVGECTGGHGTKHDCGIYREVKKIIRQLAADHFCDNMGLLFTRTELAKKMGCGTSVFQAKNGSENIDFVERARKIWIDRCEIADQWAAKEWSPRTDTHMMRYDRSMEVLRQYKRNPKKFKTILVS